MLDNEADGLRHRALMVESLKKKGPEPGYPVPTVASEETGYGSP